MTGPLSVPQVAAHWGRDHRTIRRWCNQGYFPHASQFGNRWHIPAADVLRREGRTDTATEAAAS